ncbi:hypothetical protein CVT26_008394 [Gymnopilus dilepis]|uniref:Uncharacterized protein n=1 Tax=Gymnopilus dilepis TaxID=231916 RepID=A0A409Y9B8_9AGAR|nr:hypothetical protein CVT26_008394 [Gymnopilus dilepis]
MALDYLSIPVPFTANAAIPPLLARHVPEEDAISIPLPRWNSIPDLPDIVTINTGFCPDLPSNTRVEFSRLSEEDRFALTEELRGLAAKAKSPKDLEDFTKKLKAQLKNGKRKVKTQWLRLASSILDNKILRINDKEDELLALILPHAPDHIWKTALDNIELVYQDVLKEIDTKAEGIQNHFPGFHFPWYGRLGKKNTSSQTSIDPASIQREGRQQTNSCTSIPRMAAEWSDHMSHYKRLVSVFAPLFKWIEVELKCLIPDTFQVLSHFVDILPSNEPSLVYPFSGLVLNINVTTRIHRDWGDHDVCLVVILRDCKGGELCLMEPGHVLNLENGDMVLFPSAKISHFNMHYVVFFDQCFVTHVDPTWKIKHIKQIFPRQIPLFALRLSPTHPHKLQKTAHAICFHQSLLLGMSPYAMPATPKVRAELNQTAKVLLLQKTADDPAAQKEEIWRVLARKDITCSG